MSKTYSMQVEKAYTLAKGLRKSQAQLSNYGITQEAIEQMERNAAETEILDKELDALRAQVSEKATVANKKLNELRQQVQAMKQVVKRNFEQTQWEALGVPDKR